MGGYDLVVAERLVVAAQSAPQALAGLRHGLRVPGGECHRVQQVQDPIREHALGRMCGQRLMRWKPSLADRLLHHVTRQHTPSGVMTL